MNRTPLFLIALTTVAALSPLLTFAALLQQKEWRLDRLREHMRTDGWFRLFGFVRPLVVLLCLIGVFIAPGIMAIFLPGFTIALLALLTILQFIVRKQRFPVWTMKAMMIVTLCVALNIVLMNLAFNAGMFGYDILVVLLIVLQPLIVMMSWLLLKPLDFVLKRRVMRKAADLRRTMKNIVVIGIAGSVGKTTVKELIKHLLQDLSPLATPAHVNTEMGVAQWMMSEDTRNKTQETNMIIVEMGAYRKGEIKLLCKIAQPTIGVVTALGGDHLGLFGSEEAIVDANAELLEALPADGHAFVLDASLKNRPRCPVTAIGSDLKAENVSEDGEGLQFDVVTTNNEQRTINVPLHGRHNVDNILLAIGLALHLNISLDRIAALLKTFRPLAHTFNVRTEGSITLVDDTYNASRLSFLAGLDWAAKRAERPRVLLTSGLLELGKEEDRIMEEMGKKAQTSVERVIFTSKRGKVAFERGYGKTVEVLSKDTPAVGTGSVLLAIGRMPLRTIQKLLPSESLIPNL